MKDAPGDEMSVNAQLLLRGGSIHKEMAGVWSFLPLGLRVLKYKVSSRMRHFAIDYFKANGYAFLYGFPNAMYLGEFLKQGGKIVSNTSLLFQVVNPQKLMSCKLKNRFFGNLAGCFYDIFLSVKMKDTKRVYPLSDSYQINSFDLFTDDLRGVDALRDKSGIDLVRDETYLR